MLVDEEVGAEPLVVRRIIMLLKSFRDSDAWNVAHQLTLAVYRASATFPRAEVYGLTSQLRRSAVSVPANLAEGFGRHSKAEPLRFCMIANGSLQEVKYLLLLARDLEFCPGEDYDQVTALADRTGALLGGLERSLRPATRAS